MAELDEARARSLSLAKARASAASAGSSSDDGWTKGLPQPSKAGNLDPWNRKVLNNPDKSVSTTSSISIGTDDGEVLIPTVVDGVRLSTQDAIKHYRDTGENLGTFKNAEDADVYSQALHNEQAKRMGLGDRSAPAVPNGKSSLSVPAESPTSLKNLLGAAIEPNVSLLSGAAATPLSGIAGMAGAGVGEVEKLLGVKGASPMDTAADWQRGVANALTYSPKTTGGKNAMGVINAPTEGLHEFGDYAGRKVADKFGPAAGALTDAGIEGGVAALTGELLGRSTRGTPAFARTPLDPAAAELIKKDVPVSHGQRMGGIPNKLEQVISSIPGPGDIIKRAKGRATEAWNVTEINDAIADAGGTPVPKDLKGQDAIRHAQQEFDTAYSSTLKQMKGDLNSVPPGGQWSDALRVKLQLLVSKASNIVKDSKASARVVNAIKDEVLDRFDHNGKADGAAIQEMVNKLRLEKEALAKSAEKRGLPYEKASKLLGDAMDELDKMLMRDNPTVAPKYQKLRQGYAKLSDIERASSYSPKSEGRYTPAQKLQAIKGRSGQTGNRKSFAGGAAPGQKAAQGAQRVLGDTVPDSGTTTRALGTMALLESGGLGAAMAAHPVLAGLGVMSPALYSETLLRAMNKARVSGKTPVGTAATAALPTGALGSERQQ